jgi:hypothetical protein
MLLCATLSVATLIGVGTNAVFGCWWADPLAGLVVVCLAIREGTRDMEGAMFDEGLRMLGRLNPEPPARSSLGAQSVLATRIGNSSRT